MHRPLPHGRVSTLEIPESAVLMRAARYRTIAKYLHTVTASFGNREVA